MIVLGVIGTVVAIAGGIYTISRIFLRDRQDKCLKVRASFHHEIHPVTLEPRYETQGILVTATYEGSRTHHDSLDSVQGHW